MPKAPLLFTKRWTVYKLPSLRCSVCHLRSMRMLLRQQRCQGVIQKQDEQVLQIARELGYRWGEGVAHHDLADVVRGQGEYSPALEHFAQAATILRETGEMWRESSIMSNLACLYTYLGDFTHA